MLPRYKKSLFTAVLVASAGITTASWASDTLESLKGVSVPSDSQLSSIVKDYDDLLVLGKALFWDQQAGVDGQACGSCHFHAGADSRFKNQISPHGASGSSDFAPTRSGGGDANYLLNSDDWPLFELHDRNDRNSGIRFDTDDVVSSQGVFNSVQDNFNGDVTGEDSECSQVNDPLFNVDGINTRRVEPRNAPTVFNTGFMFRLFWDGRANNRFNGVDPFGKRNENARVLRNSGGSYHAERISLKNSALASLSVGPPQSNFEMNCDGRAFSHIGRKLLNLQPLGDQEVHPDDSVLGSYANGAGNGLTTSYSHLIQEAFKNEWWDGSSDIDGFSHMETNFAFYWGLALQAYQSSLVSDDAPLDRYLDSESNHGMSTAAIRGMGVFLGDGKCIACHKGPDLTAAGHVLQSENEEGGLVERMTMGHLPGSDDSSNTYNALYDNGFYNIGVSPTDEDIGVGGLDPWGNPLSFTRQEKIRSRNYRDVPAKNAKFCANHGYTCHIPAGVTATVWYGSSEANKWSVLTNVTGSKICRNVPHGWGDPAPGYSKHCRYVVNEYSDTVPSSNAQHCANENGTCVIPQGTEATVWYGADSRWTAMSEVTSNLGCNNSVFGDPAHGTAKQCKVETTRMDSVAVPAADARHCANNYRYCDVGSVASTVWYGEGNDWAVKTDVTGLIYCRGWSFGVHTNWHATCRTVAPPNYAGPANDLLPPADAIDCAAQGQHCNIPHSERASVWYGADSRWTVRSNLHGSVSCDNNHFPDAAEGSSKSCKYLLNGPDPIFVEASKLEVESGTPVRPHERDAIDGSFKTAGLRNVELTGPYFHNGGHLTLRQVVEFYNRGGDRQRVHVGGQTCDTTGFNGSCTNVDPDIEHLSLSDSQLDDLVEFLKALTDDRVRTEKAPFDHPGITVPLGHTGDEYDITPVGTASGGTVAEDALFVLPAVGRHGRTADDRRPLPRFDELVSCSDSSGDIAACFDEAYNSTDYVEPSASATIAYAHTSPNRFLWWVRNWTLHVNGTADNLPTSSVSIYQGLTNGSGECNGSLLTHASVSNGHFGISLTRPYSDQHVCVASHGSRTALATSSVSQ
ncbi:MAG: cytochrome c peroxidase [Gammaproteobacteria bacterium]